MLENYRYNRAIVASSKRPESNSRDIFLDQEYLTQIALKQLGVKDNISPSDVPHVGTLLMTPELIPNLRVPYAIEVLGMPHSGKTSVINRYLRGLWQRNERHKVALIKEGAESIVEKYGDLRYSNHFLYTMLAGTAAFMGYISSLKDINSGMRMAVSDRGQVDRRVWRRALFSRGDVNPKIISDENQFINALENTPVQIGGIVMLMIRPNESLRKKKGVGGRFPISNIDFLSRLHEQYWRLHWELLQGEVPYRVYTCIDAEKDVEEVYETFKYAMDTALNIHNIYLAALAKAFPEEFDRAKAEYDRSPHQPSHAQRILSEKLGGGRVLIVGGDEMESEEEILEKPFVEGYHLK